MTIVDEKICPCGSKKNYLDCCEPFIIGKQICATPEQLMRSRYSAYTQVNLDYIKATMRGNALLGFQEQNTLRWAKRVRWIGLKVISSVISSGIVEFEAGYVDGTKLCYIHERSEFVRTEGRWYYVGGQHFPTPQNKVISRTSDCPCGSMRKFKNCHGS